MKWGRCEVVCVIHLNEYIDRQQISILLLWNVSLRLITPSMGQRKFCHNLSFAFPFIFESKTHNWSVSHAPIHFLYIFDNNMYHNTDFMLWKFKLHWNGTAECAQVARRNKRSSLHLHVGCIFCQTRTIFGYWRSDGRCLVHCPRVRLDWCHTGDCSSADLKTAAARTDKLPNWIK